MNFASKTYARTKDSRTDWLGDIPIHWRAVPIRRYCRVFAGATPSRTEAKFWEGGSIPWLSSGDVNLRRIGTARQFITEEGHKNSSTKWIRPESLVLALAGQGKTKGMVATVEFATTCNQSLAAIEPNLRQSRHDYLAYYLESRYIDIRALVGDGLRDGLNLEHVRSIPTPLPPLTEQTAIARFLDHVDRRIQKYIRSKDKLIALLEEYKQVLIHQAVTGQIDVRTGEPYQEHKESRVEWIREIPQHWNDISLRFASKLIQIGPFGSQLHASDYVDGGTPVINPSHMRGGQIRPDLSISINAQKVAELAKHRLETFDVVMARRGELGRCALVERGESGWICGTGSLRIKPDLKVAVPEFLVLVLGSKGTRETLSLSSVGATMNNLNSEIVSGLRIPLPPLAEQRDIVNFVDAVQSEIDKCIRHMQNQICVLGEYRTRTIADVVTGKLDVREAAAELPDTNAITWEDGVDTIQAESHSHRAEHGIAEEANA